MARSFCDVHSTLSRQQHANQRCRSGRLIQSPSVTSDIQNYRLLSAACIGPVRAAVRQPYGCQHESDRVWRDAHKRDHSGWPLAKRNLACIDPCSLVVDEERQKMAPRTLPQVRSSEKTDADRITATALTAFAHRDSVPRN